MCRATFLLLQILVLLIFGTPAAIAEIVFGANNDFQDGTVQGWQHGIPNSHAPRPAANSGPSGAGDHAMTFDSTGTGGIGGRFAAFNRDSTWTGNYLAAGVDEIHFDVSNVGNSDLYLRIGIIGGADGFVTNAIQVVRGSGWQSLTFSITPGDLTQIGGVNSATATLSAVTRLEVLSAQNLPTFGGNARGDVISAAAFFDNFMASSVSSVPEPSLASALLLAVSGLTLVRRSRVRSHEFHGVASPRG